MQQVKHLDRPGKAEAWHQRIRQNSRGISVEKHNNLYALALPTREWVFCPSFSLTAAFLR
jgi:hypothetical protein